MLTRGIWRIVVQDRSYIGWRPLLVEMFKCLTFMGNSLGTSVPNLRTELQDPASMKRALAALLLACSSFMGMATTYYVSHNGNDSNSGTSQSSPWRSIARVTQIIYSLEPGDHILFERGGVYPGRLDIPKSGTSSNPIVVGAYGSGEKPIISGGVPVTNWTQHSGNIWRASLSTAPKYVLVNNVVM